MEKEEEEKYIIRDKDKDKDKEKEKEKEKEKDIISDQGGCKACSSKVREAPSTSPARMESHSS